MAEWSVGGIGIADSERSPPILGRGRRYETLLYAYRLYARLTRGLMWKLKTSGQTLNVCPQKQLRA